MIVALILASWMILHITIPHEHPEEMFGKGIQAVLHGGDKKWWLLVLFSFFVALGGFLKNRFTGGHLTITRKSSFWLTFDFSKIFDPIREALRRGILQPILYE